MDEGSPGRALGIREAARSAGVSPGTHAHRQAPFQPGVVARESTAR